VILSTANNGGGTTLAQPAAPVALAPGESYTNTTVVTVPLAGQNVAGPRFVLVRTDVGAQQLEADEGNNLGVSAAINLLAPPPPDLVVKNLGLTRAVAPWSERLRLATDATGANAFDLLTLTVNEPLEPGAAIRRTNQVIFPASQVGERFLLVTTDVNDDVAETGPAENNTRASAAAFTIAAPDLAVTRVSAPAGTFGAPVTVTWVVENSGNAAAEAVWTDRVFLERADCSIRRRPRPRPRSPSAAAIPTRSRSPCRSIPPR
jgi:hypothetical protein